MVSRVTENSVAVGCYFTSILPITLLFTFLDYKNDGSFGKVKAGLELVYQKKQCRQA